jgi:hypothetical protein
MLQRLVRPQASSFTLVSFHHDHPILNRLYLILAQSPIETGKWRLGLISLRLVFHLIYFAPHLLNGSKGDLSNPSPRYHPGTTIDCQLT